MKTKKKRVQSISRPLVFSIWSDRKTTPFWKIAQNKKHTENEVGREMGNDTVNRIFIPIINRFWEFLLKKKKKNVTNFYKFISIFLFFLQRAVLAEKELSVLKEQFERAEDSSKRQRLSSDQANEAPPPPNMDTPLDVMGRPSLLELAAKEKEVSAQIINHLKNKNKNSHTFLVSLIAKSFVFIAKIWNLISKF